MNMHNAGTLFWLNVGSLLMDNVSVGENGLFKVNIFDKDCTVIQFVNELIQLCHLCDGYLALSNALTTSQCEVKHILDLFLSPDSFCVFLFCLCFCFIVFL